jgi:hypothetical protein
MKDGVRYVLRFGKVASTENTSSSTGSDSAADPADPEKSSADAIKVNRYLFASAQLSPLTLTAPMLEPEPAGPENPAADAPAEKPAPAPGADNSGGGGADAQETAPTETSPAETPRAKSKAKAQPAEGDQPEAPKVEPAADPAKAERERIKRENDRKLTEYREKKNKAENRVKELNLRFADWYYVVSEDVYKKLRLGRTDFIKEAATAAEEGFGVDAFRKLEKDGVKGAPAPTTPMNATPMFPSFQMP